MSFPQFTQSLSSWHFYLVKNNLKQRSSHCNVFILPLKAIYIGYNLVLNAKIRLSIENQILLIIVD